MWQEDGQRVNMDRNNSRLNTQLNLLCKCFMSTMMHSAHLLALKGTCVTLEPRG